MKVGRLPVVVVSVGGVWWVVVDLLLPFDVADGAGAITWGRGKRGKKKD